MSRVSASEVLEIMDIDLAEAQVTPYITSASVFVDEALLGKGLADNTLKEIERWLSAHMIALSRERTAQSEEAGGAKIVYAGDWGTDLNATSYGQMAKTMDTTGTLAELGKGKRQASIRAISS